MSSINSDIIVNEMKTDVLIVGSGCSGLYCAIKLPEQLKVTVITKAEVEKSDSFLAQGGMCVLKSQDDYDGYFEDTMRAGHYENDEGAVEIMIKGSRGVLDDLVSYGADFARDENGNLVYTREGAHSANRIVFHEDVTGKEITSSLLKKARTLRNVEIYERTELLDIVCENGECVGAVIRREDGAVETVSSRFTVLATGGIGGLFPRSTNYRHLTGDALAIAARHGVELKNLDYIQIHPTTFYAPDFGGRCFLISESLRGEGAKLYGKDMKRFVDELLPRDKLTEAIYAQMEKDGTDFVWEDLRPIPEEELKTHFPNIVDHCKKMGYDVTKECIPVVPAQHYFMGGIKVGYSSRTSMPRLYAVGETACNGVHGKNRLASNSLLESLVFAARAAAEMGETAENTPFSEDFPKVNPNEYTDELTESYRKTVKNKIAEAKGETI